MLNGMNPLWTFIGKTHNYSVTDLGENIMTKIIKNSKFYNFSQLKYRSVWLNLKFRYDNSN